MNFITDSNSFPIIEKLLSFFLIEDLYKIITKYLSLKIFDNENYHKIILFFEEMNGKCPGLIHEETNFYNYSFQVLKNIKLIYLYIPDLDYIKISKSDQSDYDNCYHLIGKMKDNNYIYMFSCRWYDYNSCGEDYSDTIGVQYNIKYYITKKLKEIFKLEEIKRYKLLKKLKKFNNTK
jgi:hypothetical protein